MFEINIDNNSPRISLARAAQLTGYHQDYLGQLCRLGKLKAVKIGRNWFTSAEALNNLSAPDADLSLDSSELENNLNENIGDLGTQDEDAESAILEEYTIEEVLQEIEEHEQRKNIAHPVVAQNITVSQVEDLPIAIQTVPTQIRSTNNVQNILTNMRIEGLQKEVFELRQLLTRVMEEVRNHAGIIQSREIFSRAQDSLKHSYVSNFDFTSAIDDLKSRPEPKLLVTTRPLESLLDRNFSRRYELVNWVAASAALIVAIFVGFGLIAGSFLGEQQPVSTLYYRTNVANTQTAEPSVAGAETQQNQPVEQPTLPTDSAGELTPNVVQ